jgi:hypothetical protein
LTIELLPAAILLDDHVGNLVNSFICSKSPLARQALSTAPDRIAFLALPRIDDFIIQMAAKGAIQSEDSSRIAFSARQLRPSWKARGTPTWQ